MKRGLALFLAALLTALSLTACGGGGNSAGMAVSNSAASGGSTGYDAGAPAAAPDGLGLGGAFADVEVPAEAEEGQLEADSRLASAKMVYTAGVEAETMDFDACAAGLEDLVDGMGGYMEYASVSSYADGRRIGNYTIRVPSARFNAFLKSVGEIGHITDQNKSAENISEMYYDTESRLQTQKTKLERLQMLLAQAENMEDIITLESAIAETELEVERLTGSLRHYDALVDYSSIQLQLREVPRLTTVEEAPPSFASQLKNAFTGGLAAFGDFLQGLAIFLAYNWTWLALLAVIVLLVLRISKRKRERWTEPSQKPQGEPFARFQFHRGEAAKKPDDKSEKD